MKSLALVAFLFFGMTVFCFTSTFVSWEMPELEEYKGLLERLVGKPVTGTYRLIIASSTGEFMELSGLGYWFIAAAEDSTIFVQPLSLVPNLTQTVAHEMCHLFLRQYRLPYWLEEGIVCCVTGEWIGRKELILDRVESLDYSEMDFMTYRSYSFSCWVEVSRILRERTFGELVVALGEGVDEQVE